MNLNSKNLDFWFSEVREFDFRTGPLWLSELREFDSRTDPLY